MSKLSGTSVVKLSYFLQELKEIAGTCYLTRTEYDDNIKKPCSFSHVNRLFTLTWNNALELAGIPIKKKLPFPSTQGRKPKNVTLFKTIECLSCEMIFTSIDPRINRICDKCKNLQDRDEYL